MDAANVEPMKEMILAQVSQIDMNSMISLGVLLIVGGGIAKISSLLTKISVKLDGLATVPERVAHMETHMGLFEDDLNNIFAAMRAHDNPAILVELTRRSKFRPFQPKGES